LKHAVILICFLFALTGRAQIVQDSVAIDSNNVLSAFKVKKDTSYTVKKKKDHHPRNASILSAIVPGAGQIYNRKWWKPPIIWAAMGGLGYYFLQNQNLYTEYRNDVRNLAKGDTASVKNIKYDIDQLQTKKLTYRKHRDLFAFGLIAVYAVQIIDANVDGHLRTFDVSDDLSLELRAKPLCTGTVFGAGLSLRLNFK
jgi:hypothetical protein